MPDLLANLNPEQLAAVTLPAQSALILAGAGSGKTKVLTTRIAWLISTGQVTPQGILAVTFTNKAAKEMQVRLSGMVPVNTRAMWIGTFHGLCNRFLRAHHREAGLPKLFQILDSGDQMSAVKRLCKALNVSDEKYPPKQVMYFINSAKEAGQRAKDIVANDEFNKKFVELYAAYDEQCNKEGVVDFSELLLRTYEVLKANQPIREHYRGRFRHILVDEFQDTNQLQYDWLKLMAGESGAPGSSVVFGVGDDDQCLASGTKVTMADGTCRAIERIAAGDMVRSCFGTGDFRPARVLRTHRAEPKEALIRLRLASGGSLVSTARHTHFAGFIHGASPQAYFTYLMWKKGVGYRIGTTQTYTKGQAHPVLGFKQRAVQEHADALWVLGTYESENAARFDEMLLSLTYAIPTLPFVARKGGSKNGLVHDDQMIAALFSAVRSEEGAARLMLERGLATDFPHHRAQGRDSIRHNVTVTLCGDRRGATPMHRIAVGGNDEAVAQRLREAGFSVRPAKAGSSSWRVETANKSFSTLIQQAREIARLCDGAIICKANLSGTSLPFIEAKHVRAGMAVVTGEGELDVVAAVERVTKDSRPVHDLDIEATHNYVANGVVTHNSIYAFRGARVGNMHDFERDFRVGNIIKLEQNYRSHGNILDAANALIKNNSGRLGKNLWTSAGHGEPIRVYEAQTDLEEAQWLMHEIKALIGEGARRSEIALLYRSNAQSRSIEHALFTEGIPYKVYGGLRFFERQEVKHALAYLRLIANPDDDTAFARVVNFPPRGIGARSMELLSDAANQRDMANPAGLSLWRAVGAVAGKGGSSLAAFVKMIDEMRAATANLPLEEVIDHVLDHSTLRTHYRNDRKEGQERLENLEELISAAKGFSAEEEDVLSAFLAHASLEAGDNQANEGQDAVQLMTVHAAKGLEFNAVFITGLEEGLFPHENSMLEVAGLDEERRLMYVAITRARKNLYISFAQTRMMHGQTRYNMKSRFLIELPEGVLKWLTPRGGLAPVSNKWWAGDDDATPRAKTWSNYGSSNSSGKSKYVETGYGSGSSASASSGIPQAKPREANPGVPWKLGQSVKHAKFGEGVVVRIEGSGNDARLHINFGRQGVKQLALAFAKLEAA